MEAAPIDRTPPLDWRWQALFAIPEGSENQWRALLAASQRAEEAAILAYWARRPRNSPSGR